MVFDVLVRDVLSRSCRVGHALTGSDAPGLEPAVVMCDQQALSPSNGCVIGVRPRSDVLAVLDLVDAGFAVQARVHGWPEGG